MNMGYSFLSASKDKDSGIRNIKTMLVGANKMPTLFFFNSLPSYDGAYGNLYEINRWIYYEDGKPAKVNDHFMENLYRYTLTGIKYQQSNGTYFFKNQHQHQQTKEGWLGA